MDRYLGRLAREAGAERLSIMGSKWRSTNNRSAQREPVHTVLSGPAGGVVGALTWGGGADSIQSVFRYGEVRPLTYHSAQADPFEHVSFRSADSRQLFL